MTVKEKTGRRRYIYIEGSTPTLMRNLEREILGSRVVNFKGLVVLKIRNDQLTTLKSCLNGTNTNIRMISGTLKALSRKVSELKG